MYDLQADPRQANDVLAKQIGLAREFQGYAVRELEAMGAGEQTLETARRGLEL